MRPDLLELATAAGLALAAFLLALYFTRRGNGGSAMAALPPAPSPPQASDRLLRLGSSPRPASATRL